MVIVMRFFWGDGKDIEIQSTMLLGRWQFGELGMYHGNYILQVMVMSIEGVRCLLNHTLPSVVGRGQKRCRMPCENHVYPYIAKICCCV